MVRMERFELPTFRAQTGRSKAKLSYTRIIGGKGWTWTIGAQSFNLALYQLSYPPIWHQTYESNALPTGLEPVPSPPKIKVHLIYGAASECFPRFCCLEGSCARWSTNAAYWSGWWGTIPQPLRWQRNILPIELHPHMVELVGFEPTTPSVQAKCSPNWATAPYGTRYWIRTNNLFFVREAFSHWNNRVNNMYVWKNI